MAKPSKLSGSLLARKDTPLAAASSSEITSAPHSSGTGGKPIALTVKVDQARYEALKVLGARTRRSNQDILLAALDGYLRGVGEGSE
jgi:hypothetical protein